MKRIILALAALAMCASPALANPHIHKMPRAPIGKVRPAPIKGVGESPIADNFDFSKGIEQRSDAHASSDEDGAFRLSCSADPIPKNIDPVVYPGGTSPHGHQFFGRSGVSATDTYAKIRISGTSTCGGTVNEPLNLSDYWQPALLDGVGNVVVPFFINIYYKRIPISDTRCATNTGDPTADLAGQKMGYCVTTPNGLRWVKGRSMDQSMRVGSGVEMECRTSTGDEYSPQKRSATGRIHDMGCVTGDWLIAGLAIDGCWNGTELDPADHSSHITGPVWDSVNLLTKCPTTHPYVIPHMSIIAYFKIDSTFSTWLFTSDRQMGLTAVDAGRTFHGDYMEGWSPTAKARWTAGCIDGHLSCNNGEFGDGWMIKNGDAVGKTGELIKVPDTGVN
jgi:hypothetical protein